jgi:hypothetical protein
MDSVSKRQRALSQLEHDGSDLDIVDASAKRLHKRVKDVQPRNSGSSAMVEDDHHGEATAGKVSQMSDEGTVQN